MRTSFRIFVATALLSIGALLYFKFLAPSDPDHGPGLLTLICLVFLSPGSYVASRLLPVAYMGLEAGPLPEYGDLVVWSVTIGLNAVLWTAVLTSGLFVIRIARRRGGDAKSN